MEIAGFFKCDCGKMHSVGGTTTKSVCPCGRDLFGQMMEKR